MTNRQSNSSHCETLSSSTIAQHLNLELYGRDISIEGVSTMGAPKPHTLVFARKYSDEHAQYLRANDNLLAIVCADYKGRIDGVSHIISANPRLDFIRAVSRFFAESSEPKRIHPSAVIEIGARIAENVEIGAFTFVGSDVSIGTGSIIHPHVTLAEKTTIGQGCEIKSGAVVGQAGFGFERNEGGKPILFPHVGGVNIGDNVSIGAGSTIDRGTIADTIIEDHVKIDNLVHIAHNCHLCQGVVVTGGSIISGGVHIGSNAWIAPNAVVREHLSIGSDAIVGLGSVVTKSVDSGCTVVGNPARFMRSKQNKESK